MKNNKTFSEILILGTLALSTVSMSAGVVTYTDVTTWTNAGPVGGTIDFTGLASTNYSTPLIVAPLLFGAGASSYLSILSNFGPGTGNFVATFDNVNVASSAGFGGTAFGLGFNLKCYACSGSPDATVTVTDSASNVFTFSALSSSSYFGIRSDLAIANVNIAYGAGNYAALDNIGYGGASGTPTDPTPEPGTLLMIGTGLALFAKFRRSIPMLSLA